MLYYRRRNSNEPLPKKRKHAHALVGLVNWSYDRKKHLNEEKLKELLLKVDDRYLHIYLRIINEASPAVLHSFMEKHNIDFSCIENIHKVLEEKGCDIRELSIFRIRQEDHK